MKCEILEGRSRGSMGGIVSSTNERSVLIRIRLIVGRLPCLHQAVEPKGKMGKRACNVIHCKYFTDGDAVKTILLYE